MLGCVQQQQRSSVCGMSAAANALFHMGVSPLVVDPPVVRLSPEWTAAWGAAFAHVEPDWQPLLETTILREGVRDWNQPANVRPVAKRMLALLRLRRALKTLTTVDTARLLALLPPARALHGVAQLRVGAFSHFVSLLLTPHAVLLFDQLRPRLHDPLLLATPVGTSSYTYGQLFPDATGVSLFVAREQLALLGSTVSLFVAKWWVQPEGVAWLLPGQELALPAGLVAECKWVPDRAFWGGAVGEEAFEHLEQDEEACAWAHHGTTCCVTSGGTARCDPDARGKWRLRLYRLV